MQALLVYVPTRGTTGIVKDCGRGPITGVGAGSGAAIDRADHNRHRQRQHRRPGQRQQYLDQYRRPAVLTKRGFRQQPSKTVMIRPLREADLDWALALNASLDVELSPLTRRGLIDLLDAAFHARLADPQRGLLIAFDQDAHYRSPNFLWFKARLARFVYVDRIAVAETARGRGIARRLYDDLFAAARDAGHDRIVCEVNVEPPNPTSDAFHARFGFTEIGQADLASGKVVRYLSKAL
jgi:predicted GNAT superfamily acetyltransferase